MSNKAIKALDNAAEEAVVYQAETQVRLLNEARKRKRENADEESEATSFNEIQNEVDDSDHIKVLGNRKSLMSLVRNLGLNYHRKRYKTMNAIEKYYAMLCLNSIIDINDGAFIKLLNLSDQAHQDLKTRFNLSQTDIPQPNQTLKKIYKKTEKMTLAQKHKFYTVLSFDHKEGNRKKILIAAHIYNLLSHRSDNIQKWKGLSEWSLIVKIWSNIFETLFENTIINIIWGDTVNESFKIDLRLCLSIEGRYYDISNIEFKKHGKEPRLVKADACKVLVEAKTILNQIIKHHNLNLEKSKQKKVINGQICGLKAVFTELQLVGPGCYMTNPFGKTIKFPTNDGKAMQFMEENLEQLFCYKDFVVEEAEKLRGVLLQDDSNFGSQSTAEEQYFTKKTYIISEKVSLFPKLHDDFYKSQ